MNYDRKRWGVLIASCLINLCIGSMYAWSIFSVALADKFATDINLAIVFTIANVVGPISMICGGVITDKIGPKWSILIGGIMFGGGMLLTGFTTGLAGVIVTYGLILGMGMGLAYGSTIGNSIKFFPDKRGLAGGIVTASYGISSVILPPIANSLIRSVGISMTFFILGIVFLVVILISSIFVVKCPDGYAPFGWIPPSIQVDTSPTRNKNWKQMLSTPIFYVMLIMLMCGAFFGLMTISQASPMAMKMIGINSSAAAIVVSVLALFNAAGRVSAGMISDKIGRVNTLVLMLVIACIALVLLFFCTATSAAMFYIGICLVGICFGAFMGVYPSFTADRFGAKNNGTNYGIMFIGFALAGIFGPTTMSSIFASMGSYQPAFLVALSLAVIGLIFSFVFKGITKKIDKRAME